MIFILSEIYKITVKVYLTLLKSNLNQKMNFIPKISTNIKIQRLAFKIKKFKTKVFY